MDMYNWDTRFETAENLMIHTMPGGRVTVKANIKTGTVQVEQDGKVIETHEDFYISEYNDFLQGVAEKAVKLGTVTN